MLIHACPHPHACLSNACMHAFRHVCAFTDTHTHTHTHAHTHTARARAHTNTHPCNTYIHRCQRPLGKNTSLQHIHTQHVNDHWVKEAQRLGYRSRAAFKLMQIQEKDQLIRPGDLVIDLGVCVCVCHVYRYGSYTHTHTHKHVQICGHRVNPRAACRKQN